MHKAFDVIVFDWDGTLMDSEAHIVECLALALEAVGREPGPASELRQVIGLGLGEAIAALLPGEGEAVREAAVRAYREHFLSPRPSPSELFPGVVETLDALSEHGYTLAIATGKSRRGLQKVLRETGLEGRFAATRCADETRSKPDPLMLHQLLAELDVPPGRALMVGDTEFDLLMARQAGVPGVGVSYGVHAAERLHAHRPLAILDDIRELPPWLRDRPAAASQ